MGRKRKLQSDPELAKEIEAGWQLAAIQILAHDRLGAIAYRWPRFFGLHWDLACQACDRLRRIHDAVLGVEPGENGVRLIADPDLILTAYEAGLDMVSNVVRTVQHFVQEIESSTGDVIQESTLEERLKEACGSFGITLDPKSPGYQSLVEINNVRDAIEHPKAENVYQGGDDWDKVPLAWMLSNRGLSAFERFQEWFTRIVDAWDQFLRDQGITETKLTVERGMGSKLQVKKPPRE